MTTDSSDKPVGRIVGHQGKLLLVELDDGEQLLCRVRSRVSLFGIPLNLRVRISHRRPEGRRPLILEALSEEDT